MNVEINQPLVRKRELAKTLGISPRTVDAWVAQGIIPYVAPSCRLHLFDPVQVRQVPSRGLVSNPASSHEAPGQK